MSHLHEKLLNRHWCRRSMSTQGPPKKTAGRSPFTVPFRHLWNTSSSVQVDNPGVADRWTTDAHRSRVFTRCLVTSHFCTWGQDAEVGLLFSRGGMRVFLSMHPVCTTSVFPELGKLRRGVRPVVYREGGVRETVPSRIQHPSARECG